MRKLMLFFCLVWAALPLIQAQNPYFEEGEASYYADKYQGSKTKSEELYDKNKYTAAHRTLPMGTLLEVTNKANGKKVVVRVNDRGPFIQNRIIDVSGIAARDLDMVASGVAQVTLKSLDVKGAEAYTSQSTTTVQAVPQQTTATSQTAFISDNKVLTDRDLAYLPWQYSVQLGSFSQLPNALAQMDAFHKQGITDKIRLYETAVKGKTIYKLLLGSFQERSGAESQVATLKKLHKMDCFILTLR